jgi:diaminohydroxyphosphoribosylaminopyrimidine deaminase / 5-amino-6-(5-phosphoribosylamino)uracil reductase
MEPDHLKFMNRAIEVARNGIGWVSPNPMVGCVICRNDKIIGEGWHRKYGEKHAEVNAIESVSDQRLLKDSDLYVTLEPCSHFGKTPPCADLIIAKGIKRVFIANVDPNPLIQGKGIRKLKNSGIDIIIGLAQVEAAELNKRYFTALIQNRPYIILKWAQTRDGFIADENNKSKWVSNELSRQMVHQWRSEEDAVLAGFNTVKSDNPQLSVRDWKGRNPVRVVFDKKAELTSDLNVLDRSQRTIIYNQVYERTESNLEYIKIDEANFIKDCLEHLVKTGIHSIMVEGGSSTHREFIISELWDEARIFVSNILYQKGIRAAQLRNHELVGEKKIMTDCLYVYRNQNTKQYWLNI